MLNQSKKITTDTLFELMRLEPKGTKSVPISVSIQINTKGTYLKVCLCIVLMSKNIDRHKPKCVVHFEAGARTT